MTTVQRVIWPSPGWPPEKMPGANDVADAMLSQYCEWLTAWAREGPVADPDTTYETQDFYQRQIRAAYETDSYYAVVLEVYDGDEGGPSVLTGYWSFKWTDEVNLWFMVQEFDTMVQVILEEGKLINLPKEDK